MENQLINQSNVATPSTIDADKIRSLKKIIMPEKAKDADLELFIEYCRRTNLDPFARQIYAIEVQGKLSIQTSIDGFRVIAQRTGEYRGQEVFWCDDTGVWKDVWLSNKPPAAAKVLIYRDKLDKPVAGIALYREYFRDTHIWRKMPSTMLAKCAESLAFRKAFPNELSGLYTQEEMPQGNNEVNIKEEVENPIDNTVYNIETNTYSVIEESTEIDYTIIPSGKNKGKKWNDLNIEELFKAMEYYKNKNDTNYLNIITLTFEEKASICPIGISKGCKWDELSTNKLEQYYKDYKEGKLIGYANEYAYYIENILLTRKSEENKYSNVESNREEINNISVTEDEDPFSAAHDEDWEKDWDTISNELDSTKSTLDDLVDDNTSLFNNGEKND